VPTYEYECEKCHRLFEVRQRITEPALTTCDVCKGHVKRLLSAAPFILKGEGWYVTDYPSESRKKATEAEKPKADKPAADKTAATDKPTAADKPAAKSDAAPASSSASVAASAAPAAPVKKSN